MKRLYNSSMAFCAFFSSAKVLFVDCIVSGGSTVTSFLQPSDAERNNPAVINNFAYVIALNLIQYIYIYTTSPTAMVLNGGNVYKVVLNGLYSGSNPSRCVIVKRFCA